jgi:hypothetical protein
VGFCDILWVADPRRDNQDMEEKKQILKERDIFLENEEDDEEDEDDNDDEEQDEEVQFDAYLEWIIVRIQQPEPPVQSSSKELLGGPNQRKSAAN